MNSLDDHIGEVSPYCNWSSIKDKNRKSTTLDAPAPEKVSNRELMAKYEELWDEAHDKLEQQNNRIQELRVEAQTWRRRTWIWRVGSFVTGVIIGLLPTLFL